MRHEFFSGERGRPVLNMFEVVVGNAQHFKSIATVSRHINEIILARDSIFYDDG